tara:strand:- start:393 stop:575 length:183 start_codon:yes stop_codon:yes gene_type:complete
MKKKMDSKVWLTLIGVIICLALLGLLQELLLQLPYFVSIPLTVLIVCIPLFLLVLKNGYW